MPFPVRITEVGYRIIELLRATIAYVRPISIVSSMDHASMTGL